MTEIDVGRYAKLTSLLDETQLAMMQSGLWSHEPLPLAALQSQAPFACDTMSFTNWLQFIFIPKMSELVEQKLPLPSQIALTPMLEMQLPVTTQTQALFTSIQAIDDLLSEAI